jgi:hypothetical protein
VDNFHRCGAAGGVPVDRVIAETLGNWVGRERVDHEGLTAGERADFVERAETTQLRIERYLVKTISGLQGEGCRQLDLLCAS